MSVSGEAIGINSVRGGHNEANRKRAQGDRPVRQRPTSLFLTFIVFLFDVLRLRASVGQPWDIAGQSDRSIRAFELSRASHCSPLLRVYYAELHAHPIASSSPLSFTGPLPRDQIPPIRFKAHPRPPINRNTPHYSHDAGNRGRRTEGTRRGSGTPARPLARSRTASRPAGCTAPKNAWQA